MIKPVIKFNGTIWHIEKGYVDCSDSSIVKVPGDYILECQIDAEPKLWRFRSWDGTRTSWEYGKDFDRFIVAAKWKYTTEDKLPSNFKRGDESQEQKELEELFSQSCKQLVKKFNYTSDKMISLLSLIFDEIESH